MKTLAGYTSIEPIGMGGMTDLHIAQTGTGQKVVIRFIKDELMKDREARKRFKHGANVLSKLDHPNIVKLLKYGKLKGQQYVILEFIDGPNLRELIAQRHEVLQTHPLIILSQLATALRHLHNEGVLHLDLKPENIVIGPELRVVLIDFDLACESKGKTVKLKDFPGTPTYLSPETLNEHLVEERSEIFAFGLVAYELLTTQKPFSASSPAEYRQALRSMTKEATPLTKYREDLPLDLVKLIHKCLAKHADARYPSMALVERDLKKLT